MDSLKSDFINNIVQDYPTSQWPEAAQQGLQNARADTPQPCCSTCKHGHPCPLPLCSTVPQLTCSSLRAPLWHSPWYFSMWVFPTAHPPMCWGWGWVRQQMPGREGEVPDVWLLLQATARGSNGMMGAWGQHVNLSQTACSPQASSWIVLFQLKVCNT